MKVIDGNFSKGTEEPTLREKIDLAVDECIGKEVDTPGSFVMILEDDDGMARVATDLKVEEMVYLMEFIKTSVLSSSLKEGAIH
jgi:hypothetical protein